MIERSLSGSWLRNIRFSPHVTRNCNPKELLQPLPPKMLGIVYSFQVRQAVSVYEFGAVASKTDFIGPKNFRSNPLNARVDELSQPSSEDRK